MSMISTDVQDANVKSSGFSGFFASIKQGLTGGVAQGVNGLFSDLLAQVKPAENVEPKEEMTAQDNNQDAARAPEDNDAAWANDDKQAMDDLLARLREERETLAALRSEEMAAGQAQSRPELTLVSDVDLPEADVVEDSSETEVLPVAALFEPKAPVAEVVSLAVRQTQKDVSATPLLPQEKIEDEGEALPLVAADAFVQDGKAVPEEDASALFLGQSTIQGEEKAPSDQDEVVDVEVELPLLAMIEQDQNLITQAGLITGTQGGEQKNLVDQVKNTQAERTSESVDDAVNLLEGADDQTEKEGVHKGAFEALKDAGQNTLNDNKGKGFSSVSGQGSTQGAVSSASVSVGGVAGAALSAASGASVSSAAGDVGALTAASAKASGAQNSASVSSSFGAARDVATLYDPAAQASKTAPSTRPQPSSQLTTIEQLAVHLRKQAKDGVDSMTLQLRPAEMGRIEVKLTFGEDQQVQANVVADEATTLDLLLKDVGSLQRALQDAGLRADQNSLSFSLRSDDQQNGQASTDSEGSGKKTVVAFEADDGLSLGALADDDYVLTPHRVNLRV